MRNYLGRFVRNLSTSNRNLYNRNFSSNRFITEQTEETGIVYGILTHGKKNFNKCLEETKARPEVIKEIDLTIFSDPYESNNTDLDILIESFQNCKNLEKLRLNTRFYDKSTVFNIIESLGQVSEISLEAESTSYAHEDALELSKPCANLKSLELLNIPLGNKGAMSIMESCKSLESLNLGNCQINPSTVQKILEITTANELLKSLELSGLDYSENPEWLEQLHGLIMNNSTLCKLNMQSSRINVSDFSEYSYVFSPDYCNAFMNVLQNNPRLEMKIFGIKYPNNTKNQIEDAVKDYNLITFSRLLRQTLLDIPDYLFTNEILDYTQQKCLSITNDILLDKLSNEEILQFCTHWHSPFHQGISQKLRNYEGAKWAPLFGEEEIAVPDHVTSETQEGGWKIATLTNSKQLKSEGKELQHCVGSYTTDCLSGKSHIISVRNPNGEAQSTIEFITNNQQVQLNRHYGPRNSEPSTISRNIADWIVQSYQNGDLKVNHHNLGTIKEPSSPIVSYLGVNPFCPKEYDRIVSTFKKQMLPSGEYKIPQLSQNFNNLFNELSLPIINPILPSLKAKIKIPAYDKNEHRKTLHSMRVSCNRIFGEDKVDTLVDNEKTVFIVNDKPEIIEKLNEMFDHPDNQNCRSNFVVTNPKPQDVKKILTKEALEVRQKAKESKKKQMSPTSSTQLSPIVIAKE